MSGRKTPEQHRRWERSNPVLYARVDPDTKREVLEFAKHSKCSQAEALRQLVQFGLDDVKAGAT